MNRRWTLSNSLISVILFGHQACTAYSRCGLTIVLYNNNIAFSIFVLERPFYHSQHLISSFYTMCNMAGCFNDLCIDGLCIDGDVICVDHDLNRCAWLW